MLTLKPALIATAVALAVIAAQAGVIEHLRRQKQSLNAKLAEQTAAVQKERQQTAMVNGAYAAYRAATEQMQAQMAEQQRQHRADMQRLADALAANRQWAQTELPSDIQTALNPSGQEVEP